MGLMSLASENLRPANSHVSELESESYLEMTPSLAGTLIVAL